MTRKILGLVNYPVTSFDSFRYVESIYNDIEGNWKLILTKTIANAKVFGDEITWVFKGLNDEKYYCESDEPDTNVQETTYTLLILDQV